MRVPGLTQLSTTLYMLSLTYDPSDVTSAASITIDIQTTGQFKQQTIQSQLREQLYLRNLQLTP